MMPLFIEILSVLCNILYLFLLTKKDMRCWAFAIVGSALGVLLMMQATLYGQALIYSYYVLMGLYGWWSWNRQTGNNVYATEWKLSIHSVMFVVLAVISLAAGLLLQKNTNAQNPLPDAVLTVFGFAATYMQVRKIRSSWIYWFVIDAASCWLYANQGLWLYAILMVIYCMLCIKGYQEWQSELTKNQNHSTN